MQKCAASQTRNFAAIDAVLALEAIEHDRTRAPEYEQVRCARERFLRHVAREVLRREQQMDLRVSVRAHQSQQSPTATARARQPERRLVDEQHDRAARGDHLHELLDVFGRARDPGRVLAADPDQAHEVVDGARVLHVFEVRDAGGVEEEDRLALSERELGRVPSRERRLAGARDPNVPAARRCHASTARA